MKKTREEQIEVANEIIRQLGGRKFTAMTGAKDYMALDSGLRFRLPGAGGFTKNGINMVSIILEPSDTYQMKFERLTHKRLDYEHKTIGEFFGIYNDQLQEIFTAETGLDCHL